MQRGTALPGSIVPRFFRNRWKGGSPLTAVTYLERVLRAYEGSFDIERPYTLSGRTFDAYAAFSSMSEKYVLVEKANLWTTRTYEHALFLHVDSLSPDTISDLRTFMKDVMEPELLLQGRKYPEQDHMMTYLSLNIITDTPPDDATRQAIRKFRFSRDYLLTFRGRAVGLLTVADLASGTVLTNPAAKHTIPTFEAAFG